MRPDLKKSAYEIQQEHQLARRKYSYRTGLATILFLSASGFFLAWFEAVSPTKTAPRKLFGEFFYSLGGSEGLVVLWLLVGVVFLLVGVWLFKRGHMQPKQ